MTSLQIANRKIKDLQIQHDNLKTKLKQQKEQYEDKIDKMQKDFDKKFAAIMSVVSDLQNKVNKLEDENAKLKKENAELKKRVQDLENENDILKGKAAKNTTNSSIPPSKDENIKQPNHREKSNRKQGGQKGREGKTLTKEFIENLIKQENVEVIEEEYGNPKSTETTVKYKIDTKTTIVITKITIYGNAKEEIEKSGLPQDLLNKSTVIYGSNIKTLVGVMAQEEVIAVDRMNEFIKILTEENLNISHGSICNWIHELGIKSKKIVKKLAKKLKNGKIICTDATTSNISGKKAYIRNYSNLNITVFKPSSTKSMRAIKGHNILNGYTGYIMHDHEKGLYNFGIRANHVECWIHLGRDLKYLTENVKNEWSEELWNFGWNANKRRKELKEKGINNFTDKEIEEYHNEYKRIIENGYVENSKITSKYFRDKELAVLKRVRDYETAYLKFLEDFDVPFDDNLSERDLRPTKTKKKVIGCHRSFQGLKDYCNVRSIISTCKKQSISFFRVLKAVMDGQTICVSKEGIICLAAY